ncbi:UDP-glucuronate 4-epimerase [Parapedobacter luteus]|uniref:UDP-glucuronate 4-epimerase n=1 Tax=Parapedobacter luteus TaxID=623280 RepID=A0A1T5AJF8_9SPHI|nr:NAD-dependent epimerase [Parapedobacter luteus]SKB35138.1 UDP-glucuronate 4-epimerase [Parapedobacter luteus]
MNVLVTGAAGFIGFHLVRMLLDEGHRVVGLDNINDYYDVKLKYARLASCGIRQVDLPADQLVQSETHENYHFVKADIAGMEQLEPLFRNQHFDAVLHMAAQVGVRYSLENPQAYTHSNLIGFINILECCRHYNVGHLIYASSSSIYGLNNKIPFSEADRVDQPVSLYAATKRSNELAAYSYSHLYGLKTTGLRFFTVYGPWGRPDMAMFLFVDAILKGKPLKVFNNGNLARDFTYIDDIVGGIKLVLNNKNHAMDLPKNAVYNIGNSKSVKLLDFIEAIEKHTGKKAVKELLPMQPGDVETTWADVSKLADTFGYKPQTPVDIGVKHFVEWYLWYTGQSQFVV